MSNDNEAKIVVSTDYDSFRAMIKECIKGFNEIEKEGKKSSDNLDKSLKNIGGALTGTITNLGRDLAEALTAPLRVSLTQIVAEADRARKANTPVALSLGKNPEAFAKELDELSQKTNIPTDQIREYSAIVRSLTGDDWDKSIEGLTVYSGLAAKLGRDVTGVARLAGVMEQIHHLSGADAGRFFDDLIAKSQVLGLSAQQVVAMFERLANEGKGQISAKGISQLIPGLLKSGMNPQLAEEAASRLISDMLKDPRAAESVLRRGGQLGKNEHIYDYKNFKFLISPLEYAKKLQKAERKNRHGLSEETYRYVLGDYYGLALGGFLSRFQDEETNFADVKTAPGSPLADIEKARRESKLGKRQAADLKREAKSREDGERLLDIQDNLAKKVPGGAAGVLVNEGVNLLRDVVNKGGARAKIVGAIAVGAGAKALEYENQVDASASKEELENQRVEAILRYRQFSRQTGFKGKDSAPVPEDDEDLLSGKSPEQIAKIQAEAHVQALRAHTQPVTIVGPAPVPTPPPGPVPVN